MSQVFDNDKPHWVTPQYAEQHIQSAWLGQCTSTGFISRVIRHGTQGVHSHSMLFARNGGVDALELREFKGGQRRTLTYHVSQSGRIDVFSPDISRWPEFDAAGAVAAMRQLTNQEYGWLGIWRMTARRVPFLWYLYPPSTTDTLPTADAPIPQPFCSHAVSLALHQGGGVDVVPRQPHATVSPAQLTTSLFFQYEFTIASPWCAQQYGRRILTEAENNSFQE